MRLWHVSSSVNSFLNAHAQPSGGARCLILGRTLCRLPYFMCANSEGSGETARMRRFAWVFAGRLCDKYRNLMSWLILFIDELSLWHTFCATQTSFDKLWRLLPHWNWHYSYLYFTSFSIRLAFSSSSQHCSKIGVTFLHCSDSSSSNKSSSVKGRLYPNRTSLKSHSVLLKVV